MSEDCVNEPAALHVLQSGFEKNARQIEPMSGIDPYCPSIAEFNCQ